MKISINVDQMTLQPENQAEEYQIMEIFNQLEQNNCKHENLFRWDKTVGINISLIIKDGSND